MQLHKLGLYVTVGKLYVVHIDMLYGVISGY